MSYTYLKNLQIVGASVNDHEHTSQNDGENYFTIQEQMAITDANKQKALKDLLDNKLTIQNALVRDHFKYRAFGPQNTNHINEKSLTKYKKYYAEPSRQIQYDTLPPNAPNMEIDVFKINPVQKIKSERNIKTIRQNNLSKDIGPEQKRHKTRKNLKTQNPYELCSISNFSSQIDENNLDPHVEKSTITRIGFDEDPQLASQSKTEEYGSGHVYRTSQINSDHKSDYKSNLKSKDLTNLKSRKKFHTKEKSVSLTNLFQSYKQDKDFYMTKYMNDKNDVEKKSTNKKRNTMFDNLNLTRRVKNQNIVLNDEAVNDYLITNHNSSRIEYPSPKYGSTRNKFEETMKISNLCPVKKNKFSSYTMNKNPVLTSRYPYFKGNETQQPKPYWKTQESNSNPNLQESNSNPNLSYYGKRIKEMNDTYIKMTREYTENLNTDTDSYRNIKNTIMSEPRFKAEEEPSIESVQKPIIKKKIQKTYQFPGNSNSNFDLDAYQETSYQNNTCKNSNAFTKTIKYMDKTYQKTDEYSIDLEELEPECRNVDIANLKRSNLTNDTFFKYGTGSLKKRNDKVNLSQTIKNIKSLNQKSTYDIITLASKQENNFTRASGVTSRYPIKFMTTMEEKETQALPRFMSKETYGEITTDYDSKTFFKFNTNHCRKNPEKVFRDTFYVKNEKKGVSLIESNLFNCIE